MPDRPLACVNAPCELYGQAGQAKLIVRKRYGRAPLRYLRCRHCRDEFRERKKKEQPRSPAMALALTDHIYTSRELGVALFLNPLSHSVID